MSMTIKIMGPDDLPDHDARKTHRLIPVPEGGTVEFERDKYGFAYITIIKDEGETTQVDDLTGNVYVMNEKGDTISSFGGAPIPVSPSITVNGKSCWPGLGEPPHDASHLTRWLAQNSFMQEGDWLGIVTPTGVEILCATGKTNIIPGDAYVTVDAASVGSRLT
jgi:hypothetical protein